MTTAVIAFEEIKRERPELIETIGDLLLKHPDIAPFKVAADGTRGEQRIKRMFIEAARWADDARSTPYDHTHWHTARWAIIADDASAESKELVEKRGGKPSGEGLEALILNAAVFADPEASANERALALSWLMHIVGDLHQPLHTADMFSKQFPTGNVAGTMGWVEDPLRPGSALPLHIIWDSHSRRSSQRDDVDTYARDVVKAYPRLALPELAPFAGPTDFEKWAKESHQAAIDWVFDLSVKEDLEPNPRIRFARIMRALRDGISPFDDAPKVSDEYWEKTQDLATRGLALAGYRIADIIIDAGDRFETERAMRAKIQALTQD